MFENKVQEAVYLISKGSELLEPTLRFKNKEFYSVTNMLYDYYFKRNFVSSMLKLEDIFVPLDKRIQENNKYLDRFGIDEKKNFLDDLFMIINDMTTYEVLKSDKRTSNQYISLDEYYGKFENFETFAKTIEKLKYLNFDTIFCNVDFSKCKHIIYAPKFATNLFLYTDDIESYKSFINDSFYRSSRTYWNKEGEGLVEKFIDLYPSIQNADNIEFKKFFINTFIDKFSVYSGPTKKAAIKQKYVRWGGKIEDRIYDMFKEVLDFLKANKSSYVNEFNKYLKYMNTMKAEKLLK